MVSRALIASPIVLSLAVGLWAIQRYTRKCSKLRTLLHQYRRQLLPTQAVLQQMQATFEEQLQTGLAQHIEPTGKHLLMLPTCVTQLPTGHETGECYAIDLGGTHFRVMYVKLSESKSGVDAMDVQEVSLPSHVYKGPGEHLFDFLATTLRDFINKHQANAVSNGRDTAESSPLPESPPSPQPTLPVVGFCFSFPCEQTSMNSGILVDWTKNFECTGVIGKDPVQLLSQALDRAGRPCRIEALLNDAVAVVLAQRYLDTDTKIGVIIGTGTNACYVESTSKLTKWRPAGLPMSSETVVNVEWAAFYSEHLPRCEEDYEVDTSTPHVGKYLYEKLMSGMFLGEIARRIMLTLATEAQLFGITLPPNLCSANTFSSASLAAIVEDASPDLSATAQVLKQALQVSEAQATTRACQAAKEVCEMVAQRSATLLALGLVSLLSHSGWLQNPERVTVAVDGGVYKAFPRYRGMVSTAVAKLLWPRDEQLMPLINFELIHDGSCLGAAVGAAAVAAREVQ